MRLMGREQGTQPVPRASPRENAHDARTLDPAGAATIRLAPSFKPRQQEAIQWPDGFWDRFNAASSHYNRGHYQKAKEAYMVARSLLSGYAALDAALLRTYRKLYKAAIDKKYWDEAYRELCELFRSLPAAVTNTDRKQFNKVVEVLKNTHADFSGQLLPLQNQAETTRAKPAAQTESASGIDIAVQRDNTWERPKGERPLKWQERQVTPKGFMAVHRMYDEQASGYGACRIRTYSPEGEIVSERDCAQNFYRLKMCPTGEYLIGYSDDLQMSLWTLNGDRLAERSIRREAEDNKYHVRCVDLSEDARHCLFTSTTRAYLLDQRLRTLRVWIMPPPEGYRVEHGGQDAGNERIERALAALKLIGHPTQAEIKTQFRRLALRYHPDRNPGDAAAQERMKEIIAAYKLVSEGDVLAALEGLGDREYYYKILHETELEITGTGLSMKFTIAMSGQGDWIYASHMAPHAERIYLGCYSGMVYCVDPGGNVLKVYSTDAPIDGILERRRYLYVWTHTSLYVLEDDKVANHIDLREGGLECVTAWGLIVRKGPSLMLCSEDGAWLGTVNFPQEPREAIPTATGLVAYTTKARWRVLLVGPSTVPPAGS
jgi:DnaJ domain